MNSDVGALSFRAMNVPLLKPPSRVGSEGLDSLLTPNAYLTDESRLFRCLSRDRVMRDDEMVLLEDCQTLEAILCPLDELMATDMRLVKPDENAEAPRQAPTARALKPSLAIRPQDDWAVALAVLLGVAIALALLASL